MADPQADLSGFQAALDGLIASLTDPHRQGYAGLLYDAAVRCLEQGLTWTQAINAFQFALLTAGYSATDEE